MKLNEQDKQLIQLATEVVKANNDIYSNLSMHVGCVIKAKSGKIYKGVNIKTSHSITQRTTSSDLDWLSMKYT